MNKRRADLAPGDAIHNLTLLATGMVVRVNGSTYTLGEQVDPAPAFMAMGADGTLELWPQPTAKIAFVGWDR